MASILDIAIDKVVCSLQSMSDFVRHNGFRQNHYEIRVDILLHAVLCITMTYAIWQFFYSADTIDFDEVELAIHIIVVLCGWLLGSVLTFLCLRMLRVSVDFKKLLKIYIFVHANTILMCSVATLLFFVLLNDFAISALIVDETIVRRMGGEFIVSWVEKKKLFYFQILFLVLGYLLLLLYQPAHLKAITNASSTVLFVITLVLTTSSVAVQIHFWQTIDKSEAVERVLRSPGLIPM